MTHSQLPEDHFLFAGDTSGGPELPIGAALAVMHGVVVIVVPEFVDIADVALNSGFGRLEANRDPVLVEAAAGACESVSLLVSREATMGWDPLESDVTTSGECAQIGPDGVDSGGSDAFVGRRQRQERAPRIGADADFVADLFRAGEEIVGGQFEGQQFGLQR